MNDYKYHIIDLIKRYYTDEISDVEREELLSWIDERLENRLFFESLSEESKQTEQNYRNIDLEAALRKFDKKIGYAKAGGWKKWIGYVAAAAVLIPVMIIFSTRWMQIPESASSRQPLSPGTQQAMLVLDNGKSYVLGKDKVEIEGVEVLKDEGKLIYSDTILVTEEKYNTLITPVAGEYKLLLSDGSMVYMNAMSTLKYPAKFAGDERSVYLEGEAYFDVVPGDKPFIVHTSLGSINVLGTSFGISDYPEDKEVSVTLVTGSVLYKGSDEILLIPGERLVAQTSGEITKQKVDVNEYVGWTKGKFIFDSHSLEEIMTRLSRWYDIEVSFGNPELKKKRFSGNIERYENIEPFLKLLMSTEEINYKIDGNHIRLY